MLNRSRNEFIDGDWILKQIDDEAICASFDCGDDDLNEYFRVDAVLHRQELIAQTYCLQLSTYPTIALALLDFCNDAIHFDWKGKVYDDVIVIDSRKHYAYFPAVKLTRFGVQRELQRKNVGTRALNMVKKFFLTNNRTGCRFITVDAYNKPEVIQFYEKNGFKLFPYHKHNRDSLPLYFDLKRFVTNL
jgi:GNAT superfamily N-acetyltransferase